MFHILAESGMPRCHRHRLEELLRSTNGPVRIASAYVTDRELLRTKSSLDIRLLTSLDLFDLASGATSIESLRALIESGVTCRYVPDRPRLHAKVYIFGASASVVTSANLTQSALNSNIEVGVELLAAESEKLIVWYENLWQRAKPITLLMLHDLQGVIASARRDYRKLKRTLSAKQNQLFNGSSGSNGSDETLDTLENGNRIFICNSNRRHGKRTSAGGYLLEEVMHDLGYAAAWEQFKFPGHMELVREKDVVLMFAKSVGIIAIGQAKGKVEVLPPGMPGRIYNEDYNRIVEWRIPVHWIDWRDQADAMKWKSPNFTFWEASDGKYPGLREDVLAHFLR